jgi:two-component system NarL family sensor kinase
MFGIIAAITVVLLLALLAVVRQGVPEAIAASLMLASTIALIQDKHQHTRRNRFDTTQESTEWLRYTARKALNRQESERALLAYEVSEEVRQSLMAAQLLLTKLCPTKETRLIGTGLDGAIAQLQDIAWRLRPAILDEVGLGAALRVLSERWQQESEVAVHFSLNDRARDIPEPVRSTFFRVAQEALANVRRHARASVVYVTLERRQQRLILTIHDNGQGFDPDTVWPRCRQSHNTLGLIAMQERASLTDCAFDVVSVPGQGTIIRVAAERSSSG